VRPFVRASLVALLALLVPALAAAQGLGDAAAREKQKRQATPAKAKAKVLTNDDLKKEEDGKTKTDGASGGAAGASPTMEPTSSAGAGQAERERPRGSEGGDGEVGDTRQAAIQQAQARADSARQAVVDAEARVKELGDKLNPMSPSFVYAQPNAADAAGEEARTREALRNAEAQLDGARQALVSANRDLEDVRQGRRPTSQR
jgi:hypothetical protein